MHCGYKANVEQTELAQHGIRMMLSIFPSIGAGLAALLMFIYPLSEKKMSEIEARLAERRVAASEKTWPQVW